MTYEYFLNWHEGGTWEHVFLPVHPSTMKTFLNKVKRYDHNTDRYRVEAPPLRFCFGTRFWLPWRRAYYHAVLFPCGKVFDGLNGWRQSCDYSKKDVDNTRSDLRRSK